MFVDVHCHAEMLEELDLLVKQCVSEGTKKIVSCSVDLNSMKQNLEIAKNFDEITCCLGLHPSNVLLMKEKEIKQGTEFLEKNLFSAKAIGEIGIDFKHAESEEKKQRQIKVYMQQLKIAEENNFPVVVHSRYAERKSLEILSSFNGKVLLHWFDGNKQAIKTGIERNYFFSVGPAVLFNASYLEKASMIPLENLMLETDSPVEFNGKKAKPFWVKRVAEKISEKKGIELKETEQKTTRNAEEFFSL